MEFSALSDAELVALARGGSAPAFAVLLHRHGPAVRAVVANDEDPVGAVISTYVAAMRNLPHQLEDPGHVREWLLDLAAQQVREPEPVGHAPLSELAPDERDEIWAEVDLRWPNGKVRRHVPAWLGWTALVVAIVSLGVVVPYLAVTLGNGAGDDVAWDVLRAEPFQHEEFEREEAPELVDTDDLDFELPPIDFGNPEPPPPPPPPPDPEPEPTPAPQPEFVEPEPEPVEEEEEQEEPVDEEPVDEEPVDEEPPDDDNGEEDDPPPGDEDEQD